MTTIQILLRDTDDGLVDVETTVTGADPKSSALALADRLVIFMAEIAQEKQAPAPIAPQLYCGKEFLGHSPRKLELVKP